MSGIDDTCPHCGLPLNEEGYDPYANPFPKDPPGVTHGMDDRLTFGKHSGKTVRQIIHENPDYIGWMNENVERVTFSNEVLMRAQQEAEWEKNRRFRKRPSRGYDWDDETDWFFGPDDLP